MDISFGGWVSGFLFFPARGNVFWRDLILFSFSEWLVAFFGFIFLSFPLSFFLSSGFSRVDQSYLFRISSFPLFFGYLYLCYTISGRPVSFPPRPSLLTSRSVVPTYLRIRRSSNPFPLCSCSHIINTLSLPLLYLFLPTF